MAEPISPTPSKPTRTLCLSELVLTGVSDHLARSAEVKLRI
jgi:hypothetical protein